MSSFDCDSSLILNEDPEQWEDDVREAAEAMKAFNRSLSVAIKHDEEIGGKTVPIDFVSLRALISTSQQIRIAIQSTSEIDHRDKPIA